MSPPPLPAGPENDAAPLPGSLGLLESPCTGLADPSPDDPPRPPYLPPLLPVLPLSNPTVIPLLLNGWPGNGLPGLPPPKNPRAVTSILLVASTVTVLALRSTLKKAVAVVGSWVTTAPLLTSIVEASTRLTEINSAPNETSRAPVRFAWSSILTLAARLTRRLVRADRPVGVGGIGVDCVTAARLLLSAINSPFSLHGPCR